MTTLSRHRMTRGHVSRLPTVRLCRDQILLDKSPGYLNQPAQRWLYRSDQAGTLTLRGGRQPWLSCSSAPLPAGAARQPPKGFTPERCTHPMSVLQATAAGASRPVNARRVRGWVRGGAIVICGLWLFNTLGGDESGPLLDLARLTGLEAGYAVLAALLLMARIPALDRRVGSDQLAVLHA